MRTTVEAVRRYVETDPITEGALQRGTLNIRRTARWLIRTNGWDATEEAVVSALRRYPTGGYYNPGNALEDLQAATLSARTGLAVIRFPRQPKLTMKIPELANGVKIGDEFCVLTDRPKVTLVLDNHDLPTALDTLEDDNALDTYRDIARLDIQLPKEARFCSTSFALALSMLERHGHEPITVFGPRRRCSILLDRQAARDAHMRLNTLTA